MNEKKRLREFIWKEMEKRKIARFPGAANRIPNFVGSEKAAVNVRNLEMWKRAKIVAANPDFAQRPLREFALRDGKTLIMATPKLKNGYLLIKPENVKGREGKDTLRPLRVLSFTVKKSLCTLYPNQT